MTIEKNEIFDLAFRFVTETSEHIFLTGKAGTGKTTFLKYLKEHCAKNIIVAAPTGVAAINAGGVTLHSLFQLPFQPFLPTRHNKEELLAKIRFNKQRQQLLRKMELLVIDEISMVRCDVMDAIDTILRSVRRNHDTPFGGVQVLCIGDLYQLPPVVQNQEWAILQEYYSSPFFFDSVAVKEQMPLLIELDKIYRQKEGSFVRLLNKIRNNDMSADDFEDLHLRYDPDFRPTEEKKYITLSSHNRQADEINNRQINQLLSPAYTYEAEIENDFPEHVYPVDKSLVLKQGAQVMFLKNDAVYKRYFNGKIGVVKSLDKDKIIVDCDGFDIDVPKETWENSRYSLNKADGKLEQETLGTFTQYPLRLAWAITIHKSQGLTFDHVMIDAGSAFSSGQVYVALSRCTSLEGIVLLSKIPASAIHSNDHVLKGQQSLSHRGSLAERFEGARKIFTQQLLEGIFSFEEIHMNCDQLEHLIRQNRDRMNAGAVEWVQQFRQQLMSDRAAGLKFNSQISEMMKGISEIEKNEALQKRINDAAGYFLPRFEKYQIALQQHPLVTEYKEAATPINESLLQLLTSIFTSNYYLQYCTQPFSVTTFLQHKLKFALPRFSINCYASGKKQSYTDSANPDLYDTLKRWRDMVCEETGMEIFRVANHATLKELATFLPLNKKDLLRISGFGKAKVDKYGDEILEAIESYCTLNSLETNMPEPDVKPAKEKKEKKEKIKEPRIDTKKVSFDFYKQGKSIKEIAAERSLTAGTIEGHLIYFIELGEIDLADLLSEKKQEAIREVVNIQGDVSHSILMENLAPAAVTYNELRMYFAAEKFASKQDS